MAESLAMFIKDSIHEDLCHITPHSFSLVDDFERQEPCK